MGNKNVLIGGAWPYGNNSLHLGHLAGLISGDFLARYHRQIGDNVLYVSGTDCHGTPITERAKAEGKAPKEIADYYHEEFVKTFGDMDFSYELYTKTSEEYHKKSTMELFKKMYDNGYIEEQIDLQAYCETCAKFVADRELEVICSSCGDTAKGDQCDCGHIPTAEEHNGGTCKECKKAIVMKENNNLYLKLSKLQPEIEKYASENNKNWRTASKMETEKYLKEGLRDRAVTRDIDWGVDVPVPGYENKKMYVWIEAVLGYVTTAQRYCEENGLNWEDYWKENGNNKVYMTHGKDNITFHTIILPGLLLATGENYHLPDTMVASQYLNINSEKIAKSKGNGITIKEMTEEYNTDSLRYFLLSNGPERKDSNFSLEEFILTHNADVVNKYGNFVNRTLRYKGLEEIPNGVIDEDISKLVDETYK
ncbi:MAG: methionine--tRNA ligase, partial [Oscillospiraceae bacterium]|nr:methionine--tRNA ligase [Oscillospiraceae bacterium]